MFTGSKHAASLSLNTGNTAAATTTWEARPVGAN